MVVLLLGLLGAATTMVDVMMVYVLPQKDKYEDAKNEDVIVLDAGGTVQGHTAPETQESSGADGLKDSLLAE